MHEAVAIRAARDLDLPFIFSTWLQSYKHDSFMTLPVRRDVFFDYQQRLIEALLRRPKTQVLVACQYNDADLIFGYLVGEPPRILHWVYVKKPFRNSGIMARLIKAAGYSTTLEDCVFTHLTNSLISLCKAGKIEATFNPYAGYERIEYGP